MTPVISPWVFYLMVVSERLAILSLLLFIIGIIVLVGFCLYKLIDLYTGFPSDYIQNTCSLVIKKLCKWVILVGIISCLLPSEKTIINMIVAQNVTYDRVESVTDTVETVYHDIMELFENDSNS